MTQQSQSPGTQVISQLRQEFKPDKLFPSLVAGSVTGILAVTLAIAFAAIIFKGDALAGHLPAGIGLMLLASISIGVVTALTSSLPGLVAGLQDSAIAILALVTAAITQEMSATASTDEIFFTVIAAIAVASLLTGGIFLLLGVFKLGDLIRFIPYPVIGGFLAGSGLLLVFAAISTMTNEAASFAELGFLSQADQLGKWIPGLIFAVVLLVVLRRYDHFLIIPGLLAAAIAIFYFALLLTGTSVAEAGDQGWLLQVSAEGSLWHPVMPSDLQFVNWPLVGGQIGSLVAIAVVSVITLLLNATGIELATEQNVDLNRELMASGVANLAAGMGGGMVGAHTLSDTTLVYKMGAKSRLVGVFLAVICGVILFAGGGLLRYFPNPVLGGLLLFLGLDFMIEWVYDAWFKFPKADYFTVILILFVINAVGFLEGVGLGVVLAVVLFVVNYSRVNVVKNVLSGKAIHSNVDRPRLYQQLLNQKGDWLYILRLQGFIFFGTANKLLDQVRQRIDEPGRAKPRFVVLDFGHVSGLDSSAVLSFAKMKQLAKSQNTLLIFTSLSPEMHRQLDKEVFQDGENTVWHTFPDLDHSIEWCEDRSIEIFESVGISARPKSLKEQLEEALPKVTRQGKTRPELAKVSDLLDALSQEESTKDEGHREDAQYAISKVSNLLDSLTQREKTREERVRSKDSSVSTLLSYLERKEIETGQYLMRQGDAPKALYFIEDGQITVLLETGDKAIRVRTLGAGTVVGELGIYLNQPATASVVAAEPTILYYLSKERLKRMEEEDPISAAAFHRFMAQFIAEKLIITTQTVQALSE